MNYKELIKADFHMWCKFHHRRETVGAWMKYCLSPCNRRMMAFRLRGSKLWGVKLYLNISAFFNSTYFPYSKSLECIDGGLLIVHGFSIIINCKRIGRNCTIFQQVTIGATDTGVPTIGNDVTIYCGAKVLGGITIGDDVKIGANAVVVSDIPAHSIAVGIPAKVIKKRDDEGNWVKID